MNAHSIDATVNADPASKLQKSSMMRFNEAIRNCRTRFRKFDGRASRAEFWWFSLLFLVFLIASEFVGNISGADLVLGLVQPVLLFFLLLAFSAAGVRRLHDIGLPAWPFLVPLTMTLLWVISFGSMFFLGGFGFLFVFLSWATIPAWIVLAYLLARRGQKGSNKYGPDPLAIAKSE